MFLVRSLVQKCELPMIFLWRSLDDCRPRMIRMKFVSDDEKNGDCLRKATMPMISIPKPMNTPKASLCMWLLQS